MIAIDVERTDADLWAAPSNPSSHEGAEAHALLRIDNISHILSAYGADAAEAAIASLDLVLDRLRGRACLSWVRRPGLVEISFEHRPSAGVEDILESLLDRLSLEPVKLMGVDLHLSLSCAVAGQALPAYVAAGDEGAWSRQYRQNMSIAADVLAAMSDGRVHMYWQPVRSASGGSGSLYCEALARMVDRDGRFVPPSAFIPALEALGLMRLFDRRIMAAVLDELENHPSAVLGVNISGQSARCDIWWASLFARLKRSRGMAERLVVEITESAALDAGAFAFVRELRALGCRVALDDFGVGHASVRRAMAISPDIIKLDGFFLRRAAADPKNFEFLQYLVGMAGAIAPVVIVEGVETEAQSRMAAELQTRQASQADCWQQGYHLGRASAWRSWSYHRGGDRDVRPVSLGDLAGSRRDFRAGDGPGGLGRA
ncbi:MAG TPA: EAL domain-containing protein [Sphingobium sp.]|nr:EAL domain-containing protein [Sphingobium sp.]